MATITGKVGVREPGWGSWLTIQFTIPAGGSTSVGFLTPLHGMCYGRQLIVPNGFSGTVTAYPQNSGGIGHDYHSWNQSQDYEDQAKYVDETAYYFVGPAGNYQFTLWLG